MNLEHRGRLPSKTGRHRSDVSRKGLSTGRLRRTFVPPPPGYAMLQTLLVSAVLTLGQAPPPSPALPTPSPPPPAPAPDRWLLMKELQGTGPGSLLLSERLQVSGWTEVSFTASSAEH